MLGESRDWQEGAQSPIEDRLLIAICDVACWRAIRKPFRKFETALDFAYRKLVPGFILIVPQCRIGKYRVDAVLFAKGPNNGLCIKGIEADGKQFHSTPEQIEADKAREDEIYRLVGIRMSRFTGSEIRRSPTACAQIALWDLFAFQGVTPLEEPTEAVDNGEWWDLEDTADET